jgi:predicted nucleotide-binding protein
VGRSDLGQIRLNSDRVDEVFEERLRPLGLGADDIARQSLAELRDSLEHIQTAIEHPEAFGILNLKVTATTGVLLAANSESHVTYGILPLLIARKRLIVERIRELEAVEPDEPQDSRPSAGARETGDARLSRTVFVVHGHDLARASQVARFLERLKLEAVILREQANRGQTVIEKFQRHAVNVAFAVVVMTADDFGAARDEELPDLPNRARQNVVLELGYFMGALGRDRVAALISPGVEQPSDILGIAYIPMDRDDWEPLLAQELRAAGLDVDFNLVY